MVTTALTRYGVIHSVRNEQWSTAVPFPVNNGIRALKMEVKQNIPGSVPIAGYNAHVTYIGQPILCFVCHEPDHKKRVPTKENNFTVSVQSRKLLLSDIVMGRSSQGPSTSKRRANDDTARGARRTGGGRYRYIFRDSRGHKRSDRQDGAAYVGDNRPDRGYNSRGGQHRRTKCSSGVNGNNSNPARIEVTLAVRRGITRVSEHRPITLLNTDYKLFMKVLANRLKPAFRNIFEIGQTCGIPEKSIIHNLATIRDTVLYFEEHHDDKGALLSVDFNKAFDRVNHLYLQRVMECFCIPDKIISVIKNIYRTANSRIQVNGFFTQRIPIQASVRQGCPLSMFLFALSVEPLIRMIHQNLNSEQRTTSIIHEQSVRG
ncbi:hypothetical protein ANN_08834 [Periplaneta americana]|uniref:Reverse transcriptase domain-containing protein n=1 Tax=Periplaneta americana TaxID=6978 RepID=A0ABQ8T3X3_PERAM|nr:hypothetical protein ANN_08834 [Periplaneta americana]